MLPKNDGGKHMGSARMALANPLTDRTCGDCSLCCKLLPIHAFNKPPGVWCTHCAPGRGGCKIYENKPEECSDFYCSWLLDEALGPEWRPDKCRMVLYVEGHERQLSLYVDPATPTAWRREPFFQILKDQIIATPGNERYVVIYVKNRVTVLLPNTEIDLGIPEPGDRLAVEGIGTPKARAFFKRAALP
jgi:hypothetical protein